MPMFIDDIVNAKNSPLNRADKSEKDNPGFIPSRGANSNAANKGYEDVSYSPSSRGIETLQAMQRLEHQYQYSETMNLQLTTKEGDKVSVDFRQLYAEYQSYSEFKGAQQGSQQGPSGVTYFSSKEMLEATAFETHLGFSVEGDLNDEELNAIFDVFEKVDELANSFFGGDIEKAFQQAIDLQVDFTQIGSLSLNLTQTEMRAVQYQQGAMAEYAKAQQEALNDESDEAEGNVADLPEYLQKWQAAIERLDEFFDNATDVVDEMVGETAAQRFPEQDSRSGWIERVREFHEKLQAALSESSSNVAEEVEDEAEALTELNNATAENVPDKDDD